MNATELINEAIGKLATLPTVFSAADVAAYADVSRADIVIERALQAQCGSQSIIVLEPAVPSGRYLGKKPAEQWWIGSTLRRAKIGVFHLTAGELAREMALGFDTQHWNTPPSAMLEIGRRWAMVADGYVPGTFVFPWAKIIRSSPRFATSFRSIIDPQLATCEAEINEALSSLTEREADVLRSRRGFDTGYPVTLEQIGNRYGVTRERIRQIEQKAYRKLLHPSRNRHLLWAFAADFIQHGGSLIIPESDITPRHKFLTESIGLPTAHLAELGQYIIAEESDIASYRKTLRNVRACLEVSLETPCFTTIGALQFLSRPDGERVSNAENKYRTRRIIRKQPYMLKEVLRSLGRAAHFSEIAEVCNRMFPENQATAHNWHAALGRVDSEALGIVWIGVRGTYGLTEHGYSRPEHDLFESVARIVEDQFAITQHPVSLDFVLAELSTHRRELKRSSVSLALGFNERLEPVGHGEYIPKPVFDNPQPDTVQPQYDIDAAFAAFSSTMGSGQE